MMPKVDQEKVADICADAIDSFCAEILNDEAAGAINIAAMMIQTIIHHNPSLARDFIDNIFDYTQADPSSKRAKELDKSLTEIADRLVASINANVHA